MTRPSVAVIGGGISGLAAAHRLADSADVVLYESSDSLGGKLRSASLAGTTIDVGAESFLARRPEAVRLAHELGLEVVHPVLGDAGVLVGSKLRDLPARTIMGVPGSIEVLRASKVLSPLGLFRAARERHLPPPSVVDDVSVGELVARRFGRQVVQRLVDPLLGGVYATAADDLSLNAAAPQLAAALGSGRTLTDAVAELTSATSDAPVFGGIRGGVARLASTLADSLEARGVRMVKGRPVTSLSDLGTDGVVLALPSAPAAKLLAKLAPASASVLSEIDYASVAIVSLAFDDARPLGRSGYLVPAHRDRWVKAATMTTEKWGASHYPTDRVLMRASVGRRGEAAPLQVGDDELITRVLSELRPFIGATDPAGAIVTRWGGGLPHYAPGHLSRVDAVREGLPARLVMCGAALDGVGIPACIGSATTQAEALLRELST